MMWIERIWHHHPKPDHPTAKVIHDKLKEANEEQERARKELTLAKKIAKEMIEMRETNHFAQDWKKAMRRINEQ